LFDIFSFLWKSLKKMGFGLYLPAENGKISADSGRGPFFVRAR